MQNLVAGLYIGGLLASIPLALTARPHWWVVAAVALGWPVLLCGLGAGLFKVRTAPPQF